jgi:fructose-bisphosphate aldolase class 1
MPAYEYTTAVITHGLMGRKSEEIDREELQKVLNAHGAEGWELDKVILDTAFHGEKDGHLLIFKRAAA